MTKEAGQDKHSKKIFWSVVALVAIGLGVVFVIFAVKGLLNSFVGDLLAFAFFIVAIYGIYKSWWGGGSCLTLLVISAAIFLSSQEWGQGFLKQEALTFLLNISKKAGEKLDEFQKTVYEVQGQVKTHQDELDRHQQDISNAQSNLVAQEVAIGKTAAEVKQHQSELDETGKSVQQAQKDLKEQAEKLSDFETLVQSWYSRIHNQQISGSDRKHVFFSTKDNKTCWLFFELENVPINQSIQGYFDNSPMKPRFMQYNNVIGAIFSGGTNDLSSKDYNFTYFVDVKNSNRSKVVVLDKDVYIDGKQLPLYPPEEKKSDDKPGQTK